MTTPLDALSRQQRTFVLGFMQSGNAYQAALNAGYSDLVAAQAGDILLRNDLVKKALRALRATHRESVRQQVMLATTDAIGVMMDVMRDPVMPPNARIQAAKEIMAVSGVAPPLPWWPRRSSPRMPRRAAAIRTRIPTRPSWARSR